MKSEVLPTNSQLKALQTLQVVVSNSDPFHSASTAGPSKTPPAWGFQPQEENYASPLLLAQDPIPAASIPPTSRDSQHLAIPITKVPTSKDQR